MEQRYGAVVLDASDSRVEELFVARLRDMSAIESRVLAEAVREVLAVQRRTATRARCVPDLPRSSPG